MERDHFKDLSIYERILLKCIIMKWIGGAWARLLWLRIGRGGWRF
jgi:hypothetical protein